MLKESHHNSQHNANNSNNIIISNNDFQQLPPSPIIGITLFTLTTKMLQQYNNNKTQNLLKQQNQTIESQINTNEIGSIFKI